MCSQPLPAPGSPPSKLGVATAENTGRWGHRLGWTLHTSPECTKQSQGISDNSMGAGGR